MGAASHFIFSSNAVNASESRALSRRSSWTGAALVFVLSFVAILITRWEVLDARPGVDQIGLMSEAHFLYESGFDYSALRAQTPMDQGGNYRAYVVSILPTVIAGFRTLGCTIEQSIIAYHLFIFVVAAAVCALFFAFVAWRVDSFAAVLSTVAMMLNPLLSTQADMITMEIPLICATLVTAIAVQRQQWLLATVVTLAAALIKTTGVVVTLAVATTLAFQLAVAWTRVDWTKRLTWLGILAIGGLFVGMEMAFTFWGGTLQSRIAAPQVINPLPAAIIYFPDILLLAFVGLGLTLVRLGQSYSESEGDGATRFAAFQKGILSLGSEWIFCWVLIFGNIGILMQVAFHPRYFCLSVPFVYAAFTFGLCLSFSRKWVTRSTFVGIIAINLVNFDGILFPEIPKELSRSGTFLERSHEYLENHDALVAAVKVLEARAPDRPVLVSEIVSHFVSNPGLGYVGKPLSGYTTLPNLESASLKPIAQFLLDKPAEIVVVTFQERYRVDHYFEYPMPDVTDTIIYKDGLTPPIVIYVKRFTDSNSADAHGDFFIRMTSPSSGAREVIEILRAANREDLIDSYLERLKVQPE